MNFGRFFITGSLLYAATADAQWTSNTVLNTSVAIVPKSQQNTQCISDTKNGIIIGWDDNRNNLTNSTDIFVQRLNSDGIAKWVANGVAVCTSTGTQRSVSICEGGNGSVILTWEDNRSGNYDIYAQKIDSNGVAQWTPDGVVITNALTNQKSPKMVDDNAGGAIIAWEDSVNFYFDIYAQYINAAGSVVWTANGIPICNAPNLQNNPKIDDNGFGGAIITWQDKRTNIDYDIYAQNVNSAGTLLWTTNGVQVCSTSGTQSNPHIEPDGFGGAVIAWTDKRNVLDYDIYAQRLDGFGVPQWTPNGMAVCNAINNQSGLDIKYLGSNGVAMSWKDLRTGSFDVYSQIISLSGVAVMTTNGSKISNGIRSLNPNNMADGNGGYIVAWEDSSALGFDIKSQKINSTGLIKWPSGGITVSDAVNDQVSVAQVYDGKGGAIYIWEDKRNTIDYDVFAQEIDSTGMVGITEYKNPEGVLNFYPNPSTGIVQIKIASKNIPDQLNISVFDFLGNLVLSQSLKGAETISFNLSGKLNAGLYFYTITNNENQKNYCGKFIFEN